MLIPLELSHIVAGSELQRKYAKLDLFDVVHLGTATVLEETTVSTGSLCPEIEEVESADPRERT